MNLSQFCSPVGAGENDIPFHADYECEEGRRNRFVGREEKGFIELKENPRRNLEAERAQRRKNVERA